MLKQALQGLQLQVLGPLETTNGPQIYQEEAREATRGKSGYDHEFSERNTVFEFSQPCKINRDTSDLLSSEVRRYHT